jgi:hypothetical protein
MGGEPSAGGQDERGGQEHRPARPAPPSAARREIATARYLHPGGL